MKEHVPNSEPVPPSLATWMQKCENLCAVYEANQLLKFAIRQAQLRRAADQQTPGAQHLGRCPCDHHLRCRLVLSKRIFNVYTWRNRAPRGGSLNATTRKKQFVTRRSGMWTKFVGAVYYIPLSFEMSWTCCVLCRQACQSALRRPGWKYSRHC